MFSVRWRLAYRTRKLMFGLSTELILVIWPPKRDSTAEVLSVIPLSERSVNAENVSTRIPYGGQFTFSYQLYR